MRPHVMTSTTLVPVGANVREVAGLIKPHIKGEAEVDGELRHIDATLSRD